MRPGASPSPAITVSAVADWVDVERIARSLPETEVSTWYGTPGLKVGGKGFCRLRSEPDALVVRVIDLADRDALLAQDAEAFCITPHYATAPYVLVRVELISPGNPPTGRGQCGSPMPRLPTVPDCR